MHVFPVSKARSKSDTLQKVVLDVFNNSECNSIYDVVDKVKKGVDEKTKLCVGSTKDRKDT